MAQTISWQESIPVAGSYDVIVAGGGLAGVAVVSALFAQPDVKAAAAQMRALADRL